MWLCSQIYVVLVIIFPQSLLYYRQTFFPTFVWDSVCWSHKTFCWSIRALHAHCVSACCHPQNGVLGVPLQGTKKMEAGGCYIGTVGKMRVNSPPHYCNCLFFNTNCPSSLCKRGWPSVTIYSTAYLINCNPLNNQITFMNSIQACRGRRLNLINPGY